MAASRGARGGGAAGGGAAGGGAYTAWPAPPSDDEDDDGDESEDDEAWLGAQVSAWAAAAPVAAPGPPQRGASRLAARPPPAPADSEDDDDDDDDGIAVPAAAAAARRPAAKPAPSLFIPSAHRRRAATQPSGAAAQQAPDVTLPAWAVPGSGLAIGGGAEWARIGSVGPSGAAAGALVAGGASRAELAAALAANQRYQARLSSALAGVRARRVVAGSSLRALHGGAEAGGRPAKPPRAPRAGVPRAPRGARAGGFSRYFRAPAEATTAPARNADAAQPGWLLAQQKMPITARLRPWSALERAALRLGVQWQLQQRHMEAALASAAHAPLSLAQLRAVSDAAPRLQCCEPPAAGAAGGGALPLAVVSAVATPVDVTGVDWAAVAALKCPRRSARECAAQWANFDDPELNTGEWGPAEDATLRSLAEQHGGHGWEAVAAALRVDGRAKGRPRPARSPAECLRRYQTAHSDRQLRRPWTPEEDARLQELVAQYGRGAWARIGYVMGRTANQVTHRFNRGLLPGKVRGRWKPAEDAALRAAVAALGVGAWARVAPLVPGRTDVQVRERWCNVLDPGLTKAPWGEAEDAALRAAMAALTPAGGGRVPWAAVAARVPPRTDAQCTLRWRKLQKMDAAGGGGGDGGEAPLQIEAAPDEGGAPAAAAAPGRKRAAAKPRAKKAKPLLAESDDDAGEADAADATGATGAAEAAAADEAAAAEPPAPKRARRAGRS